jgi:hypothetical protein
MYGAGQPLAVLTENVDQDGLDLLVAQQNVEGINDLSCKQGFL